MKKSTSAFVSEFMIYLLLLTGFNGVVWMGTVWMRHQISETAQFTKQTESRLVAVERRLAETTARLASEQSPQTLESKNHEMQLGLVRPAELHIVRVEQSPEARLASLQNFEIFAKEVTTGEVSVRFSSVNPGTR